MKNVIFFHSEKGGVGKSQALLWILENTVTNGKDFDIIEADTVKDIINRYGDIATYAPLQVQDDIADMGVNRIFEAIEAAKSDLVFVNMPGASSAKIEPSADIFHEALEAIGVSACIIYLADDQKHSMDFYKSSMEKGFLGNANKVAILRNQFFGKVTENWAISKIKDSPIFDMPALDPQISEIIKKTYTPLTEMAENGGGRLNTFERFKLRKWIETASPIVDFITKE